MDRQFKLPDWDLWIDGCQDDDGSPLAGEAACTPAVHEQAVGPARHLNGQWQAPLRRPARICPNGRTVTTEPANLTAAPARPCEPRPGPSGRAPRQAARASVGNWQANAAGCVSAVPSGRCSDGAVTQRLRPDQSVTKLELMRRDFKFVGASSLTHTRMKSSPSTVKAEWGVKYTTFYMLLIYMSSAPARRKQKEATARIGLIKPHLFSD